MSKIVGRVSIVEPIGSNGGMDYYDIELAESVARAGWAVDIHTSTLGCYRASGNVNVFNYFRASFRFKSVVLRLFVYAWGSLRSVVSAVVRRRRIYHCHAFHGNAAELGLILLARLFGRRVVVTIHDINSFGKTAIPSSIRRIIYGLANGIIVHNEASRRELQALLRVANDRVRIIHHGNYIRLIESHSPFTSIEAKRLLGINEHSRIVLFFGQIKRVKGLGTLLSAMPAVIRECPNVVLLIAGRPWKLNFEQYSRQIDSLGIGYNCIIHLGYIPNEKVATYFAAADVVALPYERVYQSGALLMAMSFGKAVVVSDLPGMKEVVGGNNTGRLFTCGNHQSLSQAIVDLLSDDEARARLGSKAQMHMQSEYDWSEIGRKTCRLYEELL